jgi:predicted nucleotidyltransferase component of viral defense system
MSHDIKNIEASVKARLKNIAKDENINFNQILLLYFQERLLYRISISNYKEKFFLKGGLLILSLNNFKTRPTKDIDFLACGVSNDIDDIKNIFHEISNIKVNDGVNFDSDSIETEKIAEGADYQGVRIKVKGYLGNARRKLQLDIGFSDVIIPKPQQMKYPILLNDQKRPKIKTYSLESVIAEKFEAMLRLSFLNSRMKDFYDIFVISEIRDFNGRILKKALFRTLQKRKTPIEENPAIFTRKFVKDKTKIRMWNGYMNRIGNDFIDFSEVMKRIKIFLYPIYISIIKKEEFLKTWNPQKKYWY